MTTPFPTGAAPDRGPRRTIRSFANYLDAQAAVDYLSDNGFPVESTSIIGHDVRIVEDVSGRMTVGRAAALGAASGAWFGLLLGLLFGLFSPGIAFLGVLLLGAGLGALWGALFGAVGQWATRGRRDFSSTRRIEAGQYDVVVDEAQAARAEQALAGMISSR
jgi:hypothetical protein